MRVNCAGRWLRGKQESELWEQRAGCRYRFCFLPVMISSGSELLQIAFRTSGPLPSLVHLHSAQLSNCGTSESSGSPPPSPSHLLELFLTCFSGRSFHFCAFVLLCDARATGGMPEGRNATFRVQCSGTISCISLKKYLFEPFVLFCFFV